MRSVFVWQTMECPFPSSVNSFRGSISFQLSSSVISAVSLYLPLGTPPILARSSCKDISVTLSASLTALPPSAQTTPGIMVKTMVHTRSRVSSLVDGLCFVCFVFFIRFLSSVSSVSLVSSVSFVASVPSCFTHHVGSMHAPKRTKKTGCKS